MSSHILLSSVHTHFRREQKWASLKLKVLSGLCSRVAAATSSSQCRGAEVTYSLGAGRAVVGTHDLEAVLLHLF